MILNSAVIGMGVGEKHAHIYKNHPKVRLKKIYEKDKSKVNVLKKKFPNAQFVSNEDEIFKDKKIDLISIASYDNFHAKQIIKAINNNKHVFVEKPICLYLHELRKIFFYLKKKKNVNFSSNLVLRGSPQFKKIRNFKKKNKYGKIYYLEADYNYGRLKKILYGWRSKIPFYSVTLGGAIHMVDQILWITEDLPYQVKAYSNKIVSKASKFKFHDFSVALLKFKDKKIAKVSSNFGSVTPHHHSMKIFGTKGTVIHTYKGANFYNSRDKKNKSLDFNIKFLKNQKNFILKSFLNEIFNKKKNQVIKLNEIINSMLICLAIDKSAKLNKTVNINYKKMKII